MGPIAWRILAMICLPLSDMVQAAGRKELVAVDGVFDGALQPSDLRLVGGDLRRLPRNLRCSC
jgi:hypothetical protein